MKYYYPVIFERDSEGGFIATVPDLPGCLTNGDDLTQAMYWAAEAIGTWLEGEEQIPTPTPINANDYPDAIVNVIEYDSEKYTGCAAALKSDNPIKAAAEAHNLSIKALSLRLGAPYRTVQDWMYGKHLPPKWMQRLIVERLFDFPAD